MSDKKSFGDLATKEELNEFMNKSYKHTQYCYYKPLNIINEVLKNREFWLTPVDGFNDEQDIAEFPEEERKFYFALCFATGVNENLPMWYLYSGPDGKGGRIRLTRNFLDKLIKSGTFTLCRCPKDNKPPEEVRTLKENDMECTFGDILYYKDAGETVDLKYNTAKNYNKIKSSDFELYRQTHIGFCKQIIWYYEKETRLLIKLCGDAAKTVEDDKSKFIIKLSFDEKLFKRIKVDLAPQADDVIEMFKNNSSNFSGILELIQATTSVQNSQYHGQIKMRL